jgi:hypothetical protein
MVPKSYKVIYAPRIYSRRASLGSERAIQLRRLFCAYCQILLQAADGGECGVLVLSGPLGSI